MPVIRFPPLTMEEAVDYLHANISVNHEHQLTNTNKEDLEDLYFSLGAHARDILGLWSGNEDLMESCRLVSGDKEIDADGASLLILEALWERLRSNPL
jgi:hypothetical protein